MRRGRERSVIAWKAKLEDPPESVQFLGDEPETKEEAQEDSRSQNGLFGWIQNCMVFSSRCFFFKNLSYWIWRNCELQWIICESTALVSLNQRFCNVFQVVFSNFFLKHFRIPISSLIITVCELRQSCLYSRWEQGHLEVRRHFIISCVCLRLPCDKFRDIFLLLNIMNVKHPFWAKV